MLLLPLLAADIHRLSFNRFSFIFDKLIGRGSIQWDCGRRGCGRRGLLRLFVPVIIALLLCCNVISCSLPNTHWLHLLTDGNINNNWLALAPFPVQH